MPAKGRLWPSGDDDDDDDDDIAIVHGLKTRHGHAYARTYKHAHMPL